MQKKEFKLNKGNCFVTRYGSTLEEEHPSVVYLRTKSKITPIEKKKEYNNEIENVKKDFEIYIKKCIFNCKSVENNFMYNLDITSNSIKFGKTSFLRYDVYVKPTKKRTISQNKYRLQQLSKKIDNGLEKLLNSNGILCK